MLHAGRRQQTKTWFVSGHAAEGRRADNRTSCLSADGSRDHACRDSCCRAGRRPSGRVSMIVRIDGLRRREKGKLGCCGLADDGGALPAGKVDNCCIDARAIVLVGWRAVSCRLIESVENILDPDGNSGQWTARLNGWVFRHMSESLDALILAGDGIPAQRHHQLGLCLACVARLDQCRQAHHSSVVHLALHATGRPSDLPAPFYAEPVVQ